MMLRNSRGLCAVEVRGAGEHRLDCVLALQPDNLNACQLNQLSGLPLGTTPEETEAMAERRTPGEGAKSCECRSQAQLSADAGVWPATQLRESRTGHGCRCDPGTEGPGTEPHRDKRTVANDCRRTAVAVSNGKSCLTR